ncbi:MAG: hypothetical protein HON23_06960 [Rickettsiales bacterium]|nr:hypothetical protein [Rickettsiales bacterium]
MRTKLLNDTLTQWVDDYFEHAIDRITEVHEAYSKSDNLQAFFFIMYITPKMDIPSHNAQIGALFSSDPTDDFATFAKDMNCMCQSDDLSYLRNLQLFEQVFKGQMCEVPAGDHEARLLIEEMREIFKTKFIDKIEELDQDKAYFNALDQKYGLGEYLQSSISK